VASTGMLCLGIGAAMLASACAISHASPSATLRAGGRHMRSQFVPAANIQVAYPLQSCVATMVSHSSTFRQTYDSIANRPDIRVSVTLDQRRTSRARAETEIRSFSNGDCVAEVRLHSANDAVELLAHEMEHVRERLEGTNYLLLSVARMDVHRVGVGYETRRATDTGLQVAAEVGWHAGRECEASIHTAALMTFRF
jgi:hypothetical protein